MCFYTKHGPKLIIAHDDKVHYAIAEGLLELYRETGLDADYVEITEKDYKTLFAEFKEARIFPSTFEEKCLMKIVGPLGYTAVKCFKDSPS